MDFLVEEHLKFKINGLIWLGIIYVVAATAFQGSVLYFMGETRNYILLSNVVFNLLFYFTIKKKYSIRCNISFNIVDICIFLTLLGAHFILMNVRAHGINKEQLLFTCLVFALPLLEEVVFRGLFFDLSSAGRVLTWVVSLSVFVYIHDVSWKLRLSVLVSGIIYSLVKEKFGIKYSFVVHLIDNLIVMAFRDSF